MLAVCAGPLEAQTSKAPAKAPQKAAAQTASKAAPPDLPKLAFETYTLANGLKVILHQDHRLPMVAVNLWYHVGPANEEAGRTGFAHLFEHMMFQGSKYVPGDAHFKLLEAAGASDINGTTDFDRTNYFETLPANQLEMALWLESSRMGWLLDKLDQANLTNQQDVVRNERRQGVENQPYGIVEEALYHALYPKGHPYYASVIGSHEDIQAAKLEDVKKFFKLYYAPNNASLAIVGDFDAAATKKLVEKYFGTLKRGAPAPPIQATTPPIASERRAVVTDRIELPRVYMAWFTLPIYKAGDADADAAAEILGGGKSGRLYKKLIYEKQIAQDVSVQNQSLILGSIFQITATARPGKSIAEIEAAIDEELAKFRADGPAPEEVERARNRIETRIIQGLETLGGFGGVADLLNRYNHYLGTPDFLSMDIQRYRDVSPESVRKIAQQYLKTNTRVVVHGIPGAQQLGPEVPTPKAESAAGMGAESINAAEPWREQTPKAGAARALQLPVPQTFALSNGLTVILSERPGLPVVAANLVVRSGSDSNPPEKPGLANFAAAMLDEGTATRNALQIADEVAGLGGTLGTSSSMDAAFVTARSLKKNFAAMLDLMADVVLRPSFPPAEIERERKIRLGALVQESDNPGIVAGRVTASALYGPQHPYGYREIGTEQGIKTISREDMTAFWKQNFVPNNAALVVAGNIRAAELKVLAERAFAGWPRGAPARPTLGNPATTKARLILVDKPAAAQTEIRVVRIGAARSTPDYPAMIVMNNILGGLFSSRINMNLREEHGYTYGAFSTFVFRRSAGPFLIGSGVRTDVTGPSVSEVLKEIRGMAEGQATAEEMNRSRDSLVRSIPGDFETSGSAAGSFSNIYVYDLGLDYYSKYPARIMGVTPGDVQAVAKKYLAPGEMIVIAVGDRARIEPELAKLNLGPVEIRDADGNVKK
ncbi:MAG: insulinase family protein [Acidobacteria bacterium]|nr:insulinase family protein [Acidobacteriota bacterium]MBI3663150.1 insulinase family protein [Acidobacteriota bacterium]